MHPTRILRTIGFRLAALYAALFGLSVLVLFFVIYWITGGALRQQLAVNVEGEVAALAEDFRTGGSSHASGAIGRRLASGLHPATFYLLQSPEGRKIAGNLLPFRPASGGRSCRRQVSLATMTMMSRRITTDIRRSLSEPSCKTGRSYWLVKTPIALSRSRKRSSAPSHGLSA